MIRTKTTTWAAAARTTATSSRVRGWLYEAGTGRRKAACCLCQCVKGSVGWGRRACAVKIMCQEPALHTWERSCIGRPASIRIFLEGAASRFRSAPGLALCHHVMVHAQPVMDAPCGAQTWSLTTSTTMSWQRRRRCGLRRGGGGGSGGRQRGTLQQRTGLVGQLVLPGGCCRSIPVQVQCCLPRLISASLLAPQALDAAELEAELEEAMEDGADEVGLHCPPLARGALQLPCPPAALAVGFIHAAPSLRFSNPKCPTCLAFPWCVRSVCPPIPNLLPELRCPGRSWMRKTRMGWAWARAPRRQTWRCAPPWAGRALAAPASTVAGGHLARRPSCRVPSAPPRPCPASIRLAILTLLCCPPTSRPRPALLPAHPSSPPCSAPCTPAFCTRQDDYYEEVEEPVGEEEDDDDVYLDGGLPGRAGWGGQGAGCCIVAGCRAPRHGVACSQHAPGL